MEERVGCRKEEEQRKVSSFRQRKVIEKRGGKEFIKGSKKIDNFRLKKREGTGKRRESWKSLFLRVKESGAKLVLRRGRRVYFVFEKQKRNVSKEEGLKS